MHEQLKELTLIKYIDVSEERKANNFIFATSYEANSVNRTVKYWNNSSRIVKNNNIWKEIKRLYR